MAEILLLAVLIYLIVGVLLEYACRSWIVAIARDPDTSVKDRERAEELMKDVEETDSLRDYVTFLVVWPGRLVKVIWWGARVDG